METEDFLSMVGLVMSKRVIYVSSRTIRTLQKALKVLRYYFPAAFPRILSL